jgi:hypothetical protein
MPTRTRRAYFRSLRGSDAHNDGTLIRKTSLLEIVPTTPAVKHGPTRHSRDFSIGHDLRHAQLKSRERLGARIGRDLRHGQYSERFPLHDVR